MPLEQLLAKCEAIAEEICLSAPLAVQRIKEVVLAGLDMDLDDGLELEQDGFQWLMETEDARVGAAAFANKQTPKWTAKRPPPGAGRHGRGA